MLLFALLPHRMFKQEHTLSQAWGAVLWGRGGRVGGARRLPLLGRLGLPRVQPVPALPHISQCCVCRHRHPETLTGQSECMWQALVCMENCMRPTCDGERLHGESVDSVSCSLRLPGAVGPCPQDKEALGPELTRASLRQRYLCKGSWGLLRLFTCLAESKLRAGVAAPLPPRSAPLWCGCTPGPSPAAAAGVSFAAGAAAAAGLRRLEAPDELAARLALPE
jgi:hypothetical protein